MTKPCRLFSIVALFASMLGAMSTRVRAADTAAPPTPAHPIRIVSCDAQVQSRKRGICANSLSAADFKALSPGVSWWYNWAGDPGSSIAPRGIPIEFLPMAWGDAPGSLEDLRRYLAAGHRPRYVLGINEPNLRGQAFIPPRQTAALYARVKMLTDQYRIPLIAPQMAIGSSTQDSITAFDPIERKDVTYTFMIPYLRAFGFYLKQDHPAQAGIAAIGIHTYDNIYGLKALVELTHKETGLPVWVTEYASRTSDETKQHEFLVQATDYLERTPYVEGYAWFKERVSDPHWAAGLFEAEPGQLSALGKSYVALPVHDADVYYRLPGRLPAANYVTMTDGEMYPDPDKDESTFLSSKKPGAAFAYNVQVDHAGKYAVQMCVKGKAGTITLAAGRRASITFRHEDADAWTTLPATVELSQGPQTISLRFDDADQSIRWVEFTRR